MLAPHHLPLPAQHGPPFFGLFFPPHHQSLDGYQQRNTAINFSNIINPLTGYQQCNTALLFSDSSSRHIINPSTVSTAQHIINPSTFSTVQHIIKPLTVPTAQHVRSFFEHHQTVDGSNSATRPFFFRTSSNR